VGLEAVKHESRMVVVLDEQASAEVAHEDALLGSEVLEKEVPRSSCDADEFMPAYSNNELVEYYNSVADQWVFGVIYVSLEHESFQYQIDFDGSVEPKLVSLRVLRKPFEDGERCLWYSTLRSEWIPAVIVEVLSKVSEPSQYSVRTLTGDTTITCEGVRLKHQFDVGENLEAYLGTQQGWVLVAFVSESENPSAQESARLEQMLHGMGLAFDGLHGEETCQCSIIQVRMADDTLKCIPSFLVRHCQ